MSRHVCNLNPSGNRALTQAKSSHAIVKEILVPALEIPLSSRHLRDVSDNQRYVSFLGTDQLFGGAVELFGGETFERFEVRLNFFDLFSLSQLATCSMQPQLRPPQPQPVPRNGSSFPLRKATRRGLRFY